MEQCPGKKELPNLPRGIQGAQRQHNRFVKSEPKSKPPKYSLLAELECFKEIFEPNCL